MKGLFSRARTASGAPSDENRTGSLTNSEKRKNERKKLWKIEKEIVCLSLRREDNGITKNIRNVTEGDKLNGRN